MLPCDRGADRQSARMRQTLAGAAATRPANATVQPLVPRARACRRGRLITLRLGMRGVQGLATWQPQVERAPRARCSISECHQGRGAAWTTRSRPPRGFGASSAAHAEHVLTSKCCAGRGGVGAHQRTATQHHSTAARLREIFPRRPSVASSSQATRSIETLHGSNQAHFERRVGANTPRVGANTPTSGGEAAHMWAQTRPRVGRDAHNSGPSWAHEWVWEGPRVGLGGPTWAREWGRSGPTSGPEPGPARRQSGPTTAPNWALVSTVTPVSTTTSPS